MQCPWSVFAKLHTDRLKSAAETAKCMLHVNTLLLKAGYLSVLTVKDIERRSRRAMRLRINVTAKLDLHIS